MPDRSAILLTMKFGPFPIYVFAPMKTEPHETATRSRSPRGLARSVLKFSNLLPTTPEAIALKVRYVGALSRKLDRPPDSQKNCQGCLKLRDAARTSRISS